MLAATAQSRFSRASHEPSDLLMLFKQVLNALELSTNVFAAVQTLVGASTRPGHQAHVQQNNHRTATL